MRYFYILSSFLLATLGWTSTLIAQAPANDNLCSATALTVGAGCSGMSNGDNTNATTETNEPFGICFVTPNTNTVWFSFVAPASGIVTVSTDYAIGSNDDTEIALYDLTGGNCADLSGLAELDCDQDGGSVGNGWRSTFTTTGLTTGTTYYVQVSGYSGTTGDFCITVDEVVPPANDSLCDAIPLTVGAGCGGVPNGDNSAASTEANEPAGSCFATPNTTIWYSFVAPASGATEITTNTNVGGTNTDTEIALYELTGGNCADLTGLTEVNCDQDGGYAVANNSIIRDTLMPGATYYVQVSGAFGDEGSFCIEVNEIVLPVNDALCDAIALTVDAGCSGTPNADNSFATVELDEPFGVCFSAPNPTIWYSFVAPLTGAVEITTDVDVGGTNIDTEIALYELTGGNCADLTGLTELDCDQDGGSVVGTFGYNSIINYGTLTPGTTYYIQASGWSGYEGTFCLEVNSTGGLANDSACNAIFVPVDGTPYVYDNTLATVQASDTTTLPQVPGGGGTDNQSWFVGDSDIQSSMWFEVVPPQSGRVFFDFCTHGQTDFDTQIALYEATDCSDAATFALVAANDDIPGNCGVGGSIFASGMEVACLTPGQTYYLLVDGYAGETGTFAIQIDSLPTQAPSASAIAVPTSCGNDGIVLSAVSGVSPFEYLWDDNSTDPQRYNLDTGTYVLTITDGCDSTVSASVVVAEGVSPLMVDAGADTVLCDSAFLTIGADMTAMGGGFPEESRVFTMASLGDDMGFGSHEPHQSAITPISTLTGVTIWSGDFAFDHQVFYGMDTDADPAQLIVVDYQSGASTPIGPLGPVGSTDEGATALAFNDKTQTLYHMTSGTNGGVLYTVDPNSGALTFQANVPTMSVPFWIAIDTAGVMYGLDVSNGQISQIDPATGVTTPVLTLPFSTGFQQDADFDPSTNILYGSVINLDDPDALFYARFDLSTGNVYLIPGYTDQIGAVGIRPKNEAFSYTWTPSPGALPLDDQTIANPTVAAGNNARGAYILSVIDGCGTQALDTIQVGASVDLAVQADGTPEFGAPYPQGTATANATGGFGAYTYEWSNGETTQTIVGLTAGMYTVTVTDANGCTTSAEATIDDATNLQELGISDLAVFPNPNTGTFEVSLNMTQASTVALDLYDVRGQQVYQQQLNRGFAHRVMVERQSLPQGVYMLSITTEKGRIFRRVVVE